MNMTERESLIQLMRSAGTQRRSGFIAKCFHSATAIAKKMSNDSFRPVSTRTALSEIRKVAEFFLAEQIIFAYKTTKVIIAPNTYDIVVTYSLTQKPKLHEFGKVSNIVKEE
jgi:hypothetical protein